MPQNSSSKQTLFAAHSVVGDRTKHPFFRWPINLSAMLLKVSILLGLSVFVSEHVMVVLACLSKPPERIFLTPQSLSWLVKESPTLHLSFFSSFCSPNTICTDWMCVPPPFVRTNKACTRVHTSTGSSAQNDCSSLGARKKR